jgi:glycine cleavage system aminomethyltransferase T
MVKKEASEIGTKLKVQIREMQKDAVVVKTPWVTNIKK